MQVGPTLSPISRTRLKVLVARSSRSIQPTRPRRARVAVPPSSTFRSGIVGSSALAACPSIGTTTPRLSSSKGAGMSPWALTLPTGGFAQKPHDFSRGGVFTNPRGRPKSDQCRQWVKDLAAAGFRVFVPEIADYEVRRKLIHIQAIAGIRRLDQVKATLDYAPITTDVMLRAAELWAAARFHDGHMSNHEKISLTSRWPTTEPSNSTGTASPS